MNDWREHYYHAYLIRAAIKSTDGATVKWVAEVFLKDTLLFQFRLTVSGSYLATHARTASEEPIVEHYGLLRLHARLDFGEYDGGRNVVYEHEIKTYGEEINPPFRGDRPLLYVSQEQRLVVHILQILRRINYQTPVSVERSDFDIAAWAYYLAVPEDTISPVVRRLYEEGAVSAVWVPSPVTIGAYQLAGGLGITAVGMRYLEELESELIERRRATAMPDVVDNAFRIAKYLRDRNCLGANYAVGSDIRAALALSSEEFDAADDYLREAALCEGVSGGDLAQLVLKADGVKFVAEQLKERLDLPSDAELLARNLASKASASKTFRVDTDIMADLGWDINRYWEAAQVLVDEGLAEDSIRADNAPLKGLSLTASGRRSVRHNFRRETPTIDVHTGDRISVEASAQNAAIAAGRGASVVQNVSDPGVDRLFREILHELENRPQLSDEERQEINEVVELAQAETRQDGGVNEKRLTLYFQHLALIAPDILEVAVAAATAPIVGPLPVILLIAKKVADRAKADAQGKKLA